MLKFRDDVTPARVYSICLPFVGMPKICWNAHRLLGWSGFVEMLNIFWNAHRLLGCSQSHFSHICLQQKLQTALLSLGQFQHALEELLAWMDTTIAAVDGIQEVYGEPKIIEIEISKHKVRAIFSDFSILNFFIFYEVFSFNENSFSLLCILSMHYDTFLADRLQALTFPWIQYWTTRSTYVVYFVKHSRTHLVVQYFFFQKIIFLFL